MKRRYSMDGAASHYPWSWRLQHLLRGLSTERSCSANAFKECWLIANLASWNKALRASRLVLTEYEPGKLCLRSFDEQDYLAAYCGTGNENDGAFLLSSLPRRHRCIRVVRVYDQTHIHRLSFVSSIDVEPAANLQSIVLHPRHMIVPDNEVLQAFGPLKCLRDLDLTNVHISDARAPKVAEVLRGNGPTLHSIKLTGNLLSPESAGTLLLALNACERLEDLTLEDSTVSSSCDAMAEAFRSCRALHKLSLVGMCQAGTRCNHSGNSFTTELRVCLRCMTDLFGELEDVPSLQHLTLQRTSIGDTIGERLAQFLIRHHSIQTLLLLNCTFHNSGATYIAEALSATVTLKHLKLHNCPLEPAAFSKLCSALTANTALKSLVLPHIYSTSSIIHAGNPTLELLSQECSGRVQFCLLVDRPSSVSSALAQALRCASEVKIYHWGSDVNALCSVYASLALNYSLRSLYVDYEILDAVTDETTPGTLISALCAALKACGSLHTFYMALHRAGSESQGTAPLLAEVFEALKHSPRLRKLSLTACRLSLETAQSLSVLVAHSKRSLVELHIVSVGNMSVEVLDVLHEMVTRNVFLSRINVRCPAVKDVVEIREAMDDAKECNLGLLNKAAQFVMNTEGEPAVAFRYCAYASAFDQLRDTASLREHLLALSGKSELQVSQDVNRARCYLQDNYLVYAGVVRAAVLCEAGDSSTQLDALNVDCWRSIVQFLKLSDVVR